MKKILIFLWLTLFIQCHTQQKIFPMINNKIEKFDIDDFKKYEKNNEYVKKDNEKTITAFIINENYASSIYNNYSFFKIEKLFYSNSNIKVKYLSFIEGSPIGIIYYFDESGKLIKEENTDQGYDFKPEDVVKYCESHKIKLSKGYQNSGYKTSVYKREIDGKKVWEISYAISVGKQSFIEEIILDGKTGKLLKKQQFPYTNN